MEFRSEIPAAHPEKQQIEVACANALRNLEGDWKIDIKLGETGSWWLIIITGPTGFFESLLLDGHEQKTTLIRARLEEILKGQ